MATSALLSSRYNDNVIHHQSTATTPNSLLINDQSVSSAISALLSSTAVPTQEQSNSLATNEDDYSFDWTSLASKSSLILFLLFLSAVTSGLNLGLMSLDMNELAVIGACGTPKERTYARKIIPLRRRGNYLLCSLLLGNVLVNSTLTVFLEDLTTGFIAIIASTLAIVVLGEIVPQAFCARKSLAIGANTVYLTYAFMALTFPLSYPISTLLDWVLGEERGHVYSREGLMEFIRITGHHTQLEADEVAIISGAMKLKSIRVDEIMTKLEDVFMLPLECKLDRGTLKKVIIKGYSRVPVYEFDDRRQIVAMMLAKDLALVDPDDETPLVNLLSYCQHPLVFISNDSTLDVALNEFKTGKSHMAVVRQIYDDGEVDKYYEAIGVVTLEDVIEEVLQAEINDETDTLSDNRRKRRRANAQVRHQLIDELDSRRFASASANAVDGTRQRGPVGPYGTLLNIGTPACTSNDCHASAAGCCAQRKLHELVGSLGTGFVMSLPAAEKTPQSALGSFGLPIHCALQSASSVVVDTESKQQDKKTTGESRTEHGLSFEGLKVDKSKLSQQQEPKDGPGDSGSKEDKENKNSDQEYP